MIELENITRVYKSGFTVVRALENVSLKIDQGEFVTIVGPSGSGKSTLLHIIGLLDKADAGRYIFLGRDVAGLTDNELAILRNRMIGFIFQQFHLLPRISAIENTMLPLIYAGKSGMREIAAEKIGEVGLAQRAAHRPNELSGGEQQRIAVARSLVNEPMLLLADEPTGNLDSRSEEEIICLLEDLNRKGKTIVMVTHEKQIATRGHRVIEMLDGRIISVEKGRASTGSVPGSPASVADLGDLSEKHSAMGTAEFKDHFRQAVHAILAHKMRSLLSMLGILIGVTAVIAMFALGQGARESITQRLASLGSNLLSVRPGAPRVRGVRLEAGTVTRLTLDDALAMEQLPSVHRCSPSVYGRGQLVYGNMNWNSSIRGTGVKHAEMRMSVPTAGRFFNNRELRARERVAVLGTTVVEKLFGDSNPIGKIIKINRISFRIIGVLPPKGGSHWRDRDDIVIIPVTTAMYRLFGKRYVNRIDVEVKDAGLIEQAKQEILSLTAKRHHLSGDPTEHVHIRDMTEIQEALSSTTRTMSWLLGSIAAISLLVGGIGIMNIMLVSVTERTREIGLRKAMGARQADVMTQFLIEATVMTFIGGIIGIMLGAGVATLMSKLAEWPVRISFFAVTFAAAFSIAVGMLFGLWPARQAARLDPVEALRYE